jgi:hypothetical protein
LIASLKVVEPLARTSVNVTGELPVLTTDPPLPAVV